MQLYSEAQLQSPLIKGGRLRRAGQIPFGTTRLTRGDAQPEQSWWFFHPGRVDRRLAPEDFRKKLKEIDQRLEVVWHPVNERWCLWFYAPQEIKTARLQGWKLITPLRRSNGEYLPLDERTLAFCWERLGRRYGSGREYWARIQSEFERDYDKKQANNADTKAHLHGEYWDYTQIKVSMAGKSSGSKFTNHHSGK